MRKLIETLTFGMSTLAAAALSAATLHVDSNAKALGDGTSDKPLMTIQAAADVANPGDTILVHPGTYRECVDVKRSGKPGKPIVFKSEIKHKALIYGAKVISDWQADRTGVYKTVVPEMVSEQEEKTARWTEFGDSPQKGMWLFINGSPLLRTYDVNTLRPGCFFTDLKTKSLYWMPEQGEDPTKEIAELPVRRRLFNVEGINDITIDGFAFKYNSGWSRNIYGHGDGDICARRTQRLTVLNNLFEFGSAQAVNIHQSTFGAVKDNTILWSGQCGIFMVHSGHMEISGNTIYYCNWRKISPHWESGGMKTGANVAVDIKNNTFGWNYAAGFWSDGDKAEHVIASNLAHDNTGMGLYEEVGSNQTFKDNICWNNSDGIRLTASAETLVKDNLLFNNGCGINLLWSPQYRTTRTAETAKSGTPGELLRSVGCPENTAERYEREYYSNALLTHDEHIMNNNNVIGNVMYENTENYTETRDYTKLPKNHSELRTMCLLNNFSDYNIFISAKENNVSSPVGGIRYTVDEWRKFSQRDLFSTFAKSLDWMKLPDWMKGKEQYLKMRFTPFAEVEALRPGFIDSPMTAIARGYLLRSTKIAPMPIADKEIRAYFIDLEGKTALLVWNTLANSRKNLRLKLDKDEVVLRNGYLVEKKLKLDSGVIDLPVTEVPLVLIGVTSAKELTDIELSLKDSGEKIVDFECRITNIGTDKINSTGTFSVPSECEVEPASFGKEIEPGKSVVVAVKVSALTNFVQHEAYPLVLSLNLGGKEVKYVSPFKFNRGKPTALIPISAVLPDGDISKWKPEHKIATVGRFEDITNDIFNGDKTSYQGEKDFKANIYVGWAKDAIWYRVDVTDDKLITGGDTHYYNYDAVEIFIDGRSAAGQNNAKISEGCYQVAVPASLEGHHNKRLVLACGRALSGAESDAFSTMTERTAKGYVVEGKIPLDPKFFPTGAFADGRMVKMFFQMPDRDLDNINSAEFTFGWGNEPKVKVRNFENTTNWKDMILRGEQKNTPGEAQIFVDARRHKIKLGDASVTGPGVILDTRSDGMFLTAGSREAVADWREMTLAFTPDQDGNVTLILNNSVKRMSDLIPYSWLWLDELTVDGLAEPFANGDFEDESLKGWMRRGEKKSVSVDEKGVGSTGTRSLRLFADSQLARDINVKAGQRVTIKVRVKNQEN